MAERRWLACVRSLAAVRRRGLALWFGGLQADQKADVLMAVQVILVRGTFMGHRRKALPDRSRYAPVAEIRGAGMNRSGRADSIRLRNRDGYTGRR